MTVPDPRVDAYLAGCPEAHRALLGRLRATIAEAAPEAEETIAYAMPAFRLDGRFFVSYASFAKHCSLFPASEAVVAAGGDALAPHLAGKGTIRFTVDAPLPDDLVRTIVAARLFEHG